MIYDRTIISHFFLIYLLKHASIFNKENFELIQSEA